LQLDQTVSYALMDLFWWGLVFLLGML